MMMQMIRTAQRAAIRVALAAAAVCLFVLPSVSHAADSTIQKWYITGTATWTSTSYYDSGTFYDTGGNGNISVVPGGDSQLMIGCSGIKGTLNQSGGTITVNSAQWQTRISQYTDGTYNMSGTARFVSTTKEVLFGNNGNATWTLTDSANASIAALNFGDGNDNMADHLLLSGAATFSATSLVGLTGPNEYISFTNGCTATLTVTGKDQAAYTTLVTNGFIRVDGVKQTDFSKFVVTGNTLKLYAAPRGTLILFH
jgi:hypothetical protein